MNFTQLLKEADNFRSSEMAFGGGSSQLGALMGQHMVRESRSTRMRKRPEYRKLLHEAASLTAAVLGGRVNMSALTEALDTTDFPLYFADVIDRAVLPRYAAMGKVWEGICQRRTVKDFRAAKLFDFTGGEGRLEFIKPHGTYPEMSIDEAKYEISVKKYGKVYNFPLEMFVNDDLDALRVLPELLARSVVHTENYYTSVDRIASATVYNNTNKNLINTTNGAATTNPPFSITAMGDLYKVIAKQTDVDGNPLTLGEGVQIIIEYGPALEFAVKNFLNATEVNVTTGPGGSSVTGAGTDKGYELKVSNWMRSQLVPRMNPMIPVIDPTNGGTSWYAHLGNVRPAFQVAFLRGYENPQTFIGHPGHTGSETDGDFDHDERRGKIRHFVGFGIVDTKLTYWSNGTGS
jgi:hypothetical protein